MQAQPELAVLGVRDLGVLDPYLERRRYTRGERIMAQGTAGAECYLITGGEVRLEVERPDFDSDGVIAHLGPGMLCGEFSLLDGRPRSASAYAHTDVTALVLSDAGLGRLCAGVAEWTRMLAHSLPASRARWVGVAGLTETYLPEAWAVRQSMSNPRRAS